FARAGLSGSVSAAPLPACGAKLFQRGVCRNAASLVPVWNFSSDASIFEASIAYESMVSIDFHL
ncbi:MAG: hypothetical protein RR574_02625, partial [Comamonas sp.]